MKKLQFLPMLMLLFLAGCEKEQNTLAGAEADQALDFRAEKWTICHYTESETNPYEIIEIAEQAWANAHMGHGDFLLPTWYADADGDGFGDAATSTTDCVQPEGYVANNADCDDTRSTVYPGAEEICDNQIDDDCDGKIDEDCLAICDQHAGGIIIYLDGKGGGLVAAPATSEVVRNWADAMYYCDNLEEGGYDDWFLPSKAQLQLMWENRNCGGFASNFYWSSTEYDFDFDAAWCQHFGDGYPYEESKSGGYLRVRAVRAF